MSQFLDKTGLQAIVNKIKLLFVPKTSVIVDAEDLDLVTELGCIVDATVVANINRNLPKIQMGHVAAHYQSSTSMITDAIPLDAAHRDNATTKIITTICSLSGTPYYSITDAMPSKIDANGNFTITALAPHGGIINGHVLGINWVAIRV